MKLSAWVITLLLAIRLLAPLAGRAAQTGGAVPAPTAKTGTAKGQPSAQEIADAKAKSMVWVNTATRVYHKEGSSYGATRHGKFMTEDDAKKAGFRPASEPGRGKKT